MESYIEKTAQVSGKATIYPFVTILGNSIIEDDVKIYPYTLIINSKICNGSEVHSSHIENCTIGNGSTIYSSQVTDSFVGKSCSIGPFAHIKEYSYIQNNVRIGNFVEVKKSVIGSHTKAAHLTYIGDAEVGYNTNIGCGTVFCNYDGKLKHKTYVGSNVFVGSNVNLIAPIKIGDGCFIAAGSTVSKSLDKNSFCIERGEMRVKQKRMRDNLGNR